MDVQLDTLLAYLADALPTSDRADVDRALAASAPLRGQLARLRAATTTLRDDATWDVPARAIESAKLLGRRLDGLRAPSTGERLVAAFDAAVATVAQLFFDSRVQGAYAGLRGESTVALGYRAGEIEIEFECGLGDDDRFHVVGQMTSAALAFGTVHAVVADGATIATSAVDDNGMFHLKLAPGAYRLRFEARGDAAATLEVPEFHLP